MKGLTRRQIAFWAGASSAALNGFTTTLFVTWRPEGDAAVLTVAIVGAVNVGLAAFVAFLNGSEVVAAG